MEFPVPLETSLQGRQRKLYYWNMTPKLARRPIPHILHQMWRNEDLPERSRLLRETWIRHHPHWEHRFWTDESLLEFCREFYPEMLSVLERYPHPVMRADATRYLLLKHFGGVYTDLDSECLRPLDPLLQQGELLLPLEPEEHFSSKIVQDYGLSRVVGNAWMASVPEHKFWSHLLDLLLERRLKKGPLSATGPFLLTDVIESGLPEEATPQLLPSETVSPVSNCDRAWLNSRQVGDSHAFGEEVYAIHYWEGSWWRTGIGRRRIHLLRNQRPVVAGWFEEKEAYRLLNSAGKPPRVSCLMVTGKRPSLAALAIACFRAQTYPHCELIVVDDSGTDALVDVLNREETGPFRSIRWLRLPSEGKPLGALRNVALDAAEGDFLCQWDDDDLSSPHRLEHQLATLLATGADACVPGRLQLWWPNRDWIAESSQRIWECALMWRKDGIRRYPELRAGEDTPPVDALAKNVLLAIMEAPELYTYVYHGENTFSDQHWMKLWNASQRQAIGKNCRLRLGLMQGRLPCDEYLRAVGGRPLFAREPKEL
ncbi:MAG: glycosyltransferase [Verrucomicrobiales bacterium]